MKLLSSKMLLLLLILITYGFQCEEIEYENAFQLKLPIKVIPKQRTYQLNDTISITTIIKDKHLRDLESQDLVEVRCTDIPLEVHISPVGNYNRQDTDRLEIIVDTLDFPNYSIRRDGANSRVISELLEEVFDKEEITLLQLVPKKTGYYMILPFPYSQEIYINREENCSTTNSVYDLGRMNYLFAMPNLNGDLLDEFYPDHKNGDGRILSQIETQRAFLFKVID